MSGTIPPFYSQRVGAGMSENPEARRSYSREDIIRILRDLEMMVPSLDRLGTSAAFDREHDAAQVRDFVDQWQVMPRLARIRHILSEPFPMTLGNDDMDELERLMQDVPHWTESHPDPPPTWQEPVWKDSEAMMMIAARNGRQRTIRAAKEDAFWRLYPRSIVMQGWRSPAAGERSGWDRAFDSLVDSHLKNSIVCPSCGRAALRLFFKRFDTRPRGGYWLWCPACRRY
jgi:hypothetical protein